MDNISYVIRKVNPVIRQQIWTSAYSSNTDEIRQKHLTDLEREAAYVDIFVNCDPYSSWEELAKMLYWHEQADAIEEIRSFLPPRGKFGLKVYNSAIIEEGSSCFL